MTILDSYPAPPSDASDRAPPAMKEALQIEPGRACTRPAGMATITALFGKFATPEVVRLILSDPGGFWKRGERRTVTTLFADVREFTAFAARVEPEEAVATVNEIFGCLYDAIRSQCGIVNRFLGDGMLALFGAPLALENHASAAATAALSACAAVELLADVRRAQGLEPLRIGLSINTGELVVGCIGTPERIEYTVVGHAVNVASRLVSAAAPAQILLGTETAALLRSRFDVRDKGVLELKGIGPTPVFELIGLGACGGSDAAPGAAPV